MIHSILDLIIMKLLMHKDTYGYGNKKQSKTKTELVLDFVLNSTLNNKLF